SIGEAISVPEEVAGELAFLVARAVSGAAHLHDRRQQLLLALRKRRRGRAPSGLLVLRGRLLVLGARGRRLRRGRTLAPRGGTAAGRDGHYLHRTALPVRLAA